jgi:GT2 family glycosyltransferase
MITFSVVLYNNSIEEIELFFENFNGKCAFDYEIIFVDNSSNDRLQGFYFNDNVKYVFPSENLGYARGHNLAFFNKSICSEYFIVLNLDVKFDVQMLRMSLHRLNSEVLLISPKFVGNGSGIPRVVPFPFSVTIRKLGYMFGIRSLIEIVELNSYYTSTERFLQVASGAFMIFKSETFEKLGGFDKKMWMYIEDWEISYRVWKVGRILYLPDLVVAHTYTTRGKKSLKLLLSFGLNLLRFKLLHQFPRDLNRSRIKSICEIN